MSDSAPPPPAAENPGGATPPPPPPPAAAPPPPAPYGSAPPPPAAGVSGPRPGELLDRFLARFIDGIIVAVVTFVIQIFVRLAISGFVSIIIGAVVSAIVYLGYFAFLESNRGQTIGKQVMKLRVVSATGSGNPTMNEAVKRNIWTGAGILGIVPILGTLLGGLIQLVSVIMIAVTINSDTVRRQSWFDKFAGGTQVLKEG